RKPKSPDPPRTCNSIYTEMGIDPGPWRCKATGVRMFTLSGCTANYKTVSEVHSYKDKQWSVCQAWDQAKSLLPLSSPNKWPGGTTEWNYSK
ncbi:Protein GIGANTEA, partial [Clarias magur]